MYADESDEDICRICFEVMDEASKMVAADCQHHFHGQCIVRWLKVRENCPYCRQPVKNLEGCMKDELILQLEDCMENETGSLPFSDMALEDHDEAELASGDDDLETVYSLSDFYDFDDTDLDDEIEIESAAISMPSTEQIVSVRCVMCRDAIDIFSENNYVCCNFNARHYTPSDTAYCHRGCLAPEERANLELGDLWYCDACSTTLEWM